MHHIHGACLGTIQKVRHLLYLCYENEPQNQAGPRFGLQ